jgi:hypothetical protein
MKKKYSQETKYLQQCLYAKQFAENLSLNGEEYHFMDILDVLAQSGLKLQVSEENIASTTYFEMISSENLT